MYYLYFSTIILSLPKLYTVRKFAIASEQSKSASFYLDTSVPCPYEDDIYRSVLADIVAATSMRGVKPSAINAIYQE